MVESKQLGPPRKLVLTKEQESTGVLHGGPLITQLVSNTGGGRRLMNYLITDGVFDKPQSVGRGPEQYVVQELSHLRIERVN